jgi:hypothetical protein
MFAASTIVRGVGITTSLLGLRWARVSLDPEAFMWSRSRTTLVTHGEGFAVFLVTVLFVDYRSQ